MAGDIEANVWRSCKRKGIPFDLDRDAALRQAVLARRLTKILTRLTNRVVNAGIVLQFPATEVRKFHCNPPPKDRKGKQAWIESRHVVDVLVATQARALGRIMRLSAWAGKNGLGIQDPFDAFDHVSHPMRTCQCATEAYAKERRIPRLRWLSSDWLAGDILRRKDVRKVGETEWLTGRRGQCSPDLLSVLDAEEAKKGARR